jgi:hypothetical protein
MHLQLALIGRRPLSVASCGLKSAWRHDERFNASQRHNVARMVRRPSRKNGGAVDEEFLNATHLLSLELVRCLGGLAAGKTAKHLGSQALAAPTVAGQNGRLHARSSRALDGSSHTVNKDSNWPGVRIVLRPGGLLDCRRSKLFDDIVNGMFLKPCAHLVPEISTVRFSVLGAFRKAFP